MDNALDAMQLEMEIVMPDADPEEIDRETRRLRRDMNESNFEIVEAHEAAPTGSKSPEAITLGAVTIALLPKVIPQFIDVLGKWLMVRNQRKLKLKLPNGLSCEVTGAMSSASLTELVEKLMTAKRPRAATGGK